MSRKIIIDTDPGVDDVVAMALAFLTPPNGVEISLITPVFGNASLDHTVRNTVTLLTIIDQEREWRKAHGYRLPRSEVPVVAMGAEGPIDGSRTIDATQFHGKDGIGEVHTTHPHFTPEKLAWDVILKDPPRHFVPSSEAAYVEILRVLKAEPADSVSIVAVGPLTNVARAAVEDPTTFSRVMGGTLTIPGNVTPVAEFNIGTDPEAASILFSLTSTSSETHFPAAPRLPRPLKLLLFPLDTTHQHGLHETFYRQISAPATIAGSPLASFLDAILQRTYRKIQSLVAKGRESDVVELHMHDPLCVYYAMLDDQAREMWVVEPDTDVRVECSGTWTRGMTVLDQRIRQGRPFDKKMTTKSAFEDGEDTSAGNYEGVDDDEGSWRGGTGNHVDVVWASSVLDGGNMNTVEAMARLLWQLEA